jgi:molybdopterin-guanine dinucleotide biosynthesis protein B
VYFRPEFEKHAGTVCGGAAMHVTDPELFRGFETGLRVIETARRLAPREFQWREEPYEFDPRPAIDLLSGSARFRETLDAGEVLSAEIARHRAGAEDFRKRREPYLIYPDRRPAVVSFVGGHGAGKTTLLVGLVPRLKALGLRVGAIKHSSKDAEDDVPGKDSQRLAASGAAVSAFVTPGRATVRRIEEERRIQDLIRRDFSDCDLVLVEGYKSLDFPRIEVTREGAPRPEIPAARARVSDKAFADDVPTVPTSDLEGIVREVLRAAGLDRPGARG